MHRIVSGFTAWCHADVVSTYDQGASMLGRPIISNFECVEFEPGRRIRMKTTKSTIPLDITREVEPAAGGGTLLSATIRGGSEGFGRFFEPLVQRMVARSIGKDYKRLKALLDSRATA